MQIESFFDQSTGTVTYVLADPSSGQVAVIDPVLDFDLKSGRLSTESADRVIECIRAKGWAVEWILETHAHADHLSAAQHIRAQLGGRVAIGLQIKEVLAVFSRIFRFEPGFSVDGAQFDYLLEPDEVFRVGQLMVKALHVPGHTPADLAFQVEDVVFVGDTLFMPDVGTARADFPGGDAATLYRSIQKILALPEATKLYMCHDYPPDSRQPRWVCTVAEQRADNIHVHDGIGEEQFVAMRQARDKTLAVPTLILPSIQVNVRAGNLPPAQNDGRHYLQIPINALK